MLPGGHIAFTWATLNLLQRRAGLWPEADYRLVALASLAPDLVDKPLALTLYRDTQAALFWGHNLWLHLGVWLSAWCASRVSGGPVAERRQRWRGWLPYLLAFSGHLIADRMWGFRESLFYPLGAGYWHPWVHVGEPQAMLAAYLMIVRTTPLLVVFELLGLMLLGWVAWDRKLWRPQQLSGFLHSGRFPVPDGRQKESAIRKGSEATARWNALWRNLAGRRLSTKPLRAGSGKR